MTELSHTEIEASYEAAIPDWTDHAPAVKPTLRKAITILNTPVRSIPVPDVIVDDSRDELLTEFGLATLKERYLVENEKPQDRFANSVRYYADDAGHAQRMYDYVSKQWAIGATPITSNGGNTKGNLISCFLNEVVDSLGGIVDKWVENIWLSANGGGLGTYFGNVREIGAKAGPNGKTTGAISFAKVNDTLVATISQGSNRRGAAAIYLDIDHPEVEDLIDMRRESGGDPARKCHNLHHGVLVTDAFYEAVANDDDWHFISRKTGERTGKSVKARYLFQKLVTTRLDKGEPYIINIDHVNKAMPEFQRKAGLKVTTSNLCSEIVLPTGIDQHGVDRTAVCCLFQLNLETWDQWHDHPTFIEDCARFVDNVLQDFIDNGKGKIDAAKYSALRERSIGIGVMGFHSFLQKNNLPFEGVMAKAWNLKFFKHIRGQLDAASRVLAEERGACPDAAEFDVMERFSCKMAIAPTASVSIICGGTSPGIDITPANIYVAKTLDGSFVIKNKFLQVKLDAYGKNTKAVWDSILDHGGSVAHLDFLTEQERDVFKTSFEVNPRWVIEHAADRTPYICQSQSLNLFVPPDIDKYDLMMIHYNAWQRGIKSLYYLRSYSHTRASATSGAERSVSAYKASENNDYAVCLSCE